MNRRAQLEEALRSAGAPEQIDAINGKFGQFISKCFWTENFSRFENNYFYLFKYLSGSGMAKKFL